MTKTMKTKGALLMMLIFSALVLVLSSCSEDDEPTDGVYGSNRDWTYTGEQVKFYIEGVEQSQVKEITVTSRHLPTEGENPPFPWYASTLKVKGLAPKGKITEINVDADVERFEGQTEVAGIQYSVSGEFTGSPFEHHSKMGIIVYLEKK